MTCDRMGRRKRLVLTGGILGSHLCREHRHDLSREAGRVSSGVGLWMFAVFSLIAAVAEVWASQAR